MSRTRTEKGGGRTVTGNDGRRRHITRGADTRDGGLRVEGAGDVQGGGVSRQEMRSGEGKNRERDTMMNVCQWGGGAVRQRKENNDPEKWQNQVRREG